MPSSTPQSPDGAATWASGSGVLARCRRHLQGSCGFLLYLLASFAACADSEYLADVQPLLRARCYACHGALKQQAKLRLDTVSAMVKGGESGPAVMPGSSGSSLLIQRIQTRNPDDRMPPEHEGELLSAEQVASVRAWIDDGAIGPAEDLPESDPREHWAFRPPVRPPLPQVSRPAWAHHPIDAFVAAKNDQHGLRPQPEAPRALQIRRLFVDLVGVVPTVDDWAALDLDVGAGWYERLVDRLLDDPRHGERWARHWMDIWRYSDWWGLGDQLRNSQRHIWRWRDWIVESLNADLPYDAMLRLMLAADELHPADPDRLRATGYLARNFFLFNRNQWMDEVVEHVGKGFLGLTLNCAKCHDHKYDPIPQVDYYRMRAFFEPYHVRLDVVPGEPDLQRDGLPRVFDGRLDTPTYRLVRGQETQPDTSKVISPGVPEFLTIGELSIQPVQLPLEAWRPERRPWVIDAYRAKARARVDSTQQALLETLEAVARLAGRWGDLEALTEAEVRLAVAEQDAALARNEASSLESRIAASRASWRVNDGTAASVEDRAADVAQERYLAALAGRDERETRVARARHALAVSQWKRLKATGDEAKARSVDCDQAREALQRAIREAAAPLPSDQVAYAPLAGAAWTPTRFLDSTQDDPRVGFGPRSSGRRKALAEWVTDRRHPLTARVGVNHLWNRHMGAALVSSVFDFGRNGAAPTHPELLDWLACEWMDSGWSMKHLHRLIVTSSTYRMSSGVAGGAANEILDADNQFYWRRHSIRLEAQVVRDSILAHAGELDGTRGGPSVPASEQSGSRRRSLYLFHSNNDRNLFLTTFDDAAVKECYRREQSIVPQQALALANSRLVHDASRRIAARLSESVEGGFPDVARMQGEGAFVRRAFRVLLGFEPGDAEVRASLRAMGAWASLAEGSAASSAAGSEEARVGLVWSLLNHNDFVTLR
jgi:hypothetical protein